MITLKDKKIGQASGADMSPSPAKVMEGGTGGPGALFPGSGHFPVIHFAHVHVFVKTAAKFLTVHFSLRHYLDNRLVLSFRQKSQLI